MTKQGFQEFKFPPPTTAEGEWFNLDVRGSSVILRKGIRRTYKIRLLVKEGAPLEVDGPLRNGQQINGQFEALQFQFGDTASSPVPPEIEFTVVQRKIGAWAAREPSGEPQIVRTLFNTNGTAVTVPNNDAVALYDQESDTIYPIDEELQLNYHDELRTDLWLCGWLCSLTASATYDIYLMAWANANSPSANEPHILRKWNSLSHTGVPASVSGIANHHVWNTGANNAGQSLFGAGAIRWPIGGGRIVVYNNATGASIGIHGHLWLTNRA